MKLISNQYSIDAQQKLLLINLNDFQDKSYRLTCFLFDDIDTALIQFFCTKKEMEIEDNSDIFHGLR
jgi:hypothetical protein